MRRLLLCIAALGLTAAFASPLHADFDDDYPGGGGGGCIPPVDAPPNPPPHPGHPQPGDQPNPPRPGDVPGWGGGNGNSGWGAPPVPPIPAGNPVPTIPAVAPPPPPPPPVPGTPPGGSTPGNPANGGSGGNPSPSTPAPTPRLPNMPSVGPVTSNPVNSSNNGNGPNSNPAGIVPGGINSISSPDALKKDAVDRPVGTIEVRLPANVANPKNGPVNSMPIGVPVPGNDDGPTGEPASSFVGEPLQGKFVLVLDASGSMAGSRIASLRAEASNAISGLTEEDEFDCMSYGTQFSDSTMELWGGLMPATDSNKNQAINFVNGPSLNPGGGTPTYRALQKACNIYPKDLSKMILVTDGAPNATGNASKILQDFPAWWAEFSGETLFVGVCIGGQEAAVDFMRSLCAIANGTFINKP